MKWVINWLKCLSVCLPRSLCWNSLWSFSCLSLSRRYSSCSLSSTRRGSYWANRWRVRHGCMVIKLLHMKHSNIPKQHIWCIYVLAEMQREHQRREHRLQEAHCCALSTMEEARQHQMRVEIMFSPHCTSLQQLIYLNSQLTYMT